jgi:hypothetical protein
MPPDSPSDHIVSVNYVHTYAWNTGQLNLPELYGVLDLNATGKTTMEDRRWRMEERISILDPRSLSVLRENTPLIAARLEWRSIALIFNSTYPECGKITAMYSIPGYAPPPAPRAYRISRNLVYGVLGGASEDSLAKNLESPSIARKHLDGVDVNLKDARITKISNFDAVRIFAACSNY